MLLHGLKITGSTVTGHKVEVVLTEIRNTRHHLQGADVFSHAGVVFLLGRQIVQLLKRGLVLATDQLQHRRRTICLDCSLLPERESWQTSQMLHRSILNRAKLQSDKFQHSLQHCSKSNTAEPRVLFTVDYAQQWFLNRHISVVFPWSAELDGSQLIRHSSCTVSLGRIGAHHAERLRQIWKRRVSVVANTWPNTFAPTYSEWLGECLCVLLVSSKVQKKKWQDAFWLIRDVFPQPEATKTNVTLNKSLQYDTVGF